jgi:hypothetical protein
MENTLSRATIRQVQKLEANNNYAIVFNHPITQDQLTQLMDICKKANIHAICLVDAQIMPLEKAVLVLSQVQLQPAIESLVEESLKASQNNPMTQDEEKEVEKMVKESQT